MNKRLLSLLLALLMLLSLVPTTAFAVVGRGDIPTDAPAAGEDALSAADIPVDVDKASSAADLADGENMDFIHPNDGVTVTVDAPLSSDGENDAAKYAPAVMVLGDNLGLEAGGAKYPRYISPNTEKGTHTVTFDLGTVRRVSTVQIYWYNNNFTNMTLKVSAEEEGDNWTEVFARTERIRSAIQQITFTEQDVRRIQIVASKCDDQGFNTDCGGYYDIGIYTVHAYKDAPPIDSSESGTTPAGNLAQIGVVRGQNKSFASVGTGAVDPSVLVRASASGWPSGSQAQHDLNKVGNAFDGNTETSWTAPANATNPWLVVNLGANRTVKGFTMVFGKANVKGFTIEGTTDPQGEWDVLCTKTSDTPFATSLAENLDSDRPARFIRLTITDYDKTINPSVVLSELGIYKDEQAAPIITPEGNLCQVLEGVTATASNSENNTFVPAKTIDGLKDATSRWGTGQNVTTAWLVIDLGNAYNISQVSSYWCSDQDIACAKGYKIYVSESQLAGDAEGWGDPVYTSTESPAANRDGALAPETVAQFEPVKARCIKIATQETNPAVTYKNVSIHEVEIYRDHQEPETAETVNLARLPGATYSCSNRETDNFGADKAFDGDTTSAGSRWSTSNDIHKKGVTERWLKVDFHRRVEISSFDIYWRQRTAEQYYVETSLDGVEWTAHAAKTTAPTQDHETFTLDEPVVARFARLRVTKCILASGWYNTSVFEFVVNGVALDDFYTAQKRDEICKIPGGPVEISNGKVVLKQAALDLVPEGLELSIIGSNLEQVVGADGTIYTPLVDKTVEIDVALSYPAINETVNNAFYESNNTNKTYHTITIPGAHTANEGNPKPGVLPEIMEWYSAPGQVGQKFTLTENSRIIHRYGEKGGFNDVANHLTEDVEALFGFTLEHVHVDSWDQAIAALRDGDIIIYNVRDEGVEATRGFDYETYRMDITSTVYDSNSQDTSKSINHVAIYANGGADEQGRTGATGAYWATRTLLQALKLSDAAGKGLTIDHGSMRDYPEFKVRTFVLDVGRKPASMAKLQDIVKNMAWYKMNDFHVHLNDNLIFLEDYISGAWTVRENYDKANVAYSAFRLESDIPEEEGAVAPLTAKDYHYTKQEYRKFVEDSATVGVTIVSEIDVPAHAKAITDAFPSLRLFNDVNQHNHPYNDHLDLTGQYRESLAKVQEIFDEYIDSGVFGTAAHFGADEYYDHHPSYRRFVGDMIDYLNGKENLTTKRVWGSLTTLNENLLGEEERYPAEEIHAEGIQMNIWNTGWSDPQEMCDLGFDLINVVDGANYIVPDSGYYHPTGLGHGNYNWDPNNFSGTWIPAGSSQMLGGGYGMWNDSIDTRANGVDEQAVFNYFFDSLPYYACALWGKGSMTLAEAEEQAEILFTAPGTNPTNEVSMEDDAVQFFRYPFTDGEADTSGNGRDLALTNAEVNQGVLSLKGKASYAETGLYRLPWGTKLSFKAFKLEGSDKEQILFESDAAYDEYTVKALPGSDAQHWKLGFSRELYDYVYEDVELPVGEWVTLELVNDQRTTTLYVNGDEGHIPTGSFLSDENSNTPFRGKTVVSGTTFGGVTATSYLATPVARIGSKTNAFVGYLDDISAAPAAGVAVKPGKYDIDVAGIEVKAGTQYISSMEDNSAGNVKDNDTATFWHTKWNSSVPADDKWIAFDLGSVQPVTGLRYLPRGNGTGRITKYEVYLSSDQTAWDSNTGWELVAEGTWANTDDWKEMSFTADEARYIKLKAIDVEGQSSSNGSGTFYAAAEIRVTRPAEWGVDGEIAVTLDNTSYPLADNGKAEPLPLVVFDGLILENEKDYTLSYRANDAAGTATLIVTPAGSYIGDAQEVAFTVTAPPAKTDLSTASATFPKTSYPLEDGEAKPNPVVKVGDKTLLLGIDYTLEYANNDVIGETATVTIKGMGDYVGETTATFTVAAPEGKKDLSLAVISLPNSAYDYTGSPLTPIPTVSYDGVNLVAGVDYTVSYANNTAVGTATVTVTALGDQCEGSNSVTFRIVDGNTVKYLSDRSKTKVTFAETSYDLVNGKAEPDPVVTYDGTTLVKGQDYDVIYRDNTTAGATAVVTVRGKGNYVGDYVTTFKIKGGTTSNPGGNTSSGSSGGSSGGNTTSVKQADGVTVSKTTDATGVIATEATYPSGAKVSGVIAVDGLVTAVVTVPEKADEVTVTVPTRTAPTAGQVAVILHPDGTEEIVKTSLPNADGVQLTLEKDAIVQIVDNTKTFTDVSDNSWASDAIRFVTAREIFNGTGNSTFSPNSDMSRAMACTVLANLSGVDTRGGKTWYDKAVDWAMETGISDGTVPNEVITREQLVTMLYRYSGSPEVTAQLPDTFRDSDTVSRWAEQAVIWAVENGLLRGRSDPEGVDLAPKATASRAEVAALFQRYLTLGK